MRSNFVQATKTLPQMRSGNDARRVAYLARRDGLGLSVLRALGIRSLSRLSLKVAGVGALMFLSGCAVPRYADGTRAALSPDRCVSREDCNLGKVP
jgi:hypothetical protein